jgi:hypothetical protein
LVLEEFGMKKVRQASRPAARPLLDGALNLAPGWGLRNGPQMVDEVITQFTF